MTLTHHRLIIVVLFLLTSSLCYAYGDRNHFIRSEHLNENRAIVVSVPDDYSESDKVYPVVYILDGEYRYNFAKGTIDHLTNDYGYLPEVILVSIPNTDRVRDFLMTAAPTPDNVTFSKFLELELVPFVKENYRTNGFDLISGWSLSANLVAHIVTSRPQLFDGYMMGQADLSQEMMEVFKSSLTEKNYRGKFIYLNFDQKTKSSEALMSHLKKVAPVGLKSHMAIEEKSDHPMTLFSDLQKGIIFVFSEFYFPKSRSPEKAEEIFSYYESLSTPYRFPVMAPKGAIYRVAVDGILTQPAEVIEMLKMGIELYPESASLHALLAETYVKQKNDQEAVKYFKQAAEKSKSNMVLHMKYKARHEKLMN